MSSNILAIYCDGGARGNPGPAACAYVVKHAEVIQEKCGKYLGIATNNEAEYAAVLEALKWLSSGSTKAQRVDFYLDSLLVVNQFKGTFQVKDAKLARLMDQAQDWDRKLKNQFPNLRLSYNHIAREKNVLADQLVNETLDRQLL